MFKLEEVTQKIERFKDLKKVDITYFLLKPFVKAHLYFDKKRNELIYELKEPKISQEDRELLKKIYNDLLQLVDLSPKDIDSKKKLIEFLENKVRYLLKEHNYKISEKRFEKIMYYIYRDFAGLDKIEPLMHDDYIEDINCNGTNIDIYIKHRLFGSIRTKVRFEDATELKNFIIKLAQRCNKYITYTNPSLCELHDLPDEEADRLLFSVPEVLSRSGVFSYNPIADLRYQLLIRYLHQPLLLDDLLGGFPRVEHLLQHLFGYPGAYPPFGDHLYHVAQVLGGDLTLGDGDVLPVEKAHEV